MFPGVFGSIRSHVPTQPVDQSVNPTRAASLSRQTARAANVETGGVRIKDPTISFACVGREISDGVAFLAVLRPKTEEVTHQFYASLADGCRSGGPTREVYEKTSMQFHHHQHRAAVISVRAPVGMGKKIVVHK